MNKYDLAKEIVDFAVNRGIGSGLDFRELVEAMEIALMAGKKALEEKNAGKN